MTLLLACGSSSTDDPAPDSPNAPPIVETPATAAAPETAAAPDTASPAVISVTPANGSSGVTKDARVVFTFSKPMDRGATEAAYASADLPASAVTFTWNAAATELSVTPVAGLAYASGVDFTTVARSYAVTLGTGAKDVGGNALGAPSVTTFTTLREVALTLPMSTTASGTFVKSSDTGGFFAANPSEYFCGDGVTNRQTMSFLTFDASAVPTDATIASATLATRQVEVVGAPFTDLGAATITGVTFAATTGAVLAPLSGTAVGNLSSGPDLGPRSVEATAHVAAALAARATNGDVVQFRLAFASVSDGISDVDRVDFLPPELSVVVLAR